MTDADTDELWNAFHRIVNVTSRELSDRPTGPLVRASTEWIRGAGVPQRTTGHRAPHRSAVANEEEDR